MNDAELLTRQEFAIRIAREAGVLTLRYYRNAALAVELKQDQSPVTEADKNAELYLREQIAAKFPADGILGEEFPERPGTSGFRWILDPIDGTKSFISGVPIYANLIGVEHSRQSVVGIINIPALNELAYAAVGHGAWYVLGSDAPARAHVSKKKTLGEGLFVTSEVKTYYDMQRERTWLALNSAARLTRTWGDAYGYLLVATGRAELCVDPKMNLWDCAALQPVLEEAGGTFTDWEGKPTIYAPEAIATNGLVQDETLRIVRSST